MPLRSIPLALAAASLALLTACGADPAATPAADTGAASDSGDTSSTGDAGPASDSAGTDATSADTADTDTADTAAASPAEGACTALATAVCSGAQGCCGGAAPAGCQADWSKACLKLGWADLDDALSAGTLQKDAAADSACQQAVQAAVAGCDRQAASRALGLCMRAWIDPAKVGEPCAAPVELPCAAGGGRCTAKTIDTYVCTNAVGEGAACSLTQPCQAGLECLDSGLTRAKTCGKPGSTCNLADKCWDGWQCEAGACVKASAAAPASCAKDEDCPTTQLCGGGKCAPKLCQ